MSFDLRIQFLGLNAYVPETGERTRMHVLLPLMKHTAEHEEGSPGGGHVEHGGVHAHQDMARFRDGEDMFTGRTAEDKSLNDKDRHHPGLMYDHAYLKPNGSALDRHYHYEDLEGRVLDLSGLSTPEGYESRLPGELPSLEGVSLAVPRVLVRELPKERLAARVTMAHGALTYYALGATFHLHDILKYSRMTWETEWTIRGIHGHVDPDGVPCLPRLVLEGPKDGNRFELPYLYPIGQTIRLTIFNAVSTVFPPKGALFRIPKPMQKTDHFLAYHTLSAPSSDPPLKPVAADEMEVTVTGPVPKPLGNHVPGVICVQVQSKLAAE